MFGMENRSNDRQLLVLKFANWSSYYLFNGISSRLAKLMPQCSTKVGGGGRYRGFRAEEANHRPPVHLGCCTSPRGG
jgi:hypothetical protein